jgi:hypothetical protein
MSLGFDPTPSVDDIHTVGGKRWRWNGIGWEPATLKNTFMAAVRQDYYETLVTTAPTPVAPMAGVLLTYL